MSLPSKTSKLPPNITSKKLRTLRFDYIIRSFNLKRKGEENDLELEKLRNKVVAQVKLERGKILDKEVERDSKGVIDEFIGDNTEVVEI